MMEDVKLGFRLLKYSHGKKLTIISCIIMLAVGILQCMATTGSEYADTIGGYFFACGAMYSMQQLSGVMVSGLVASSPMKKHIQTKIAAKLSAVCMLAVYILYIAVDSIIVILKPELIGLIANQIVVTVLFFGVVIIYSSMAYKLFEISTLFFGITAVPMIVYNVIIVHRKTLPVDSFIGLFGIMLLGAIAILLICYLSYFILKATYKLPISKNSQHVLLRKNM